MSAQGVRIDPSAALAEATALGQQFVAGARTLKDIDSKAVVVGATPREAIWREGKITLYRFRGEREPRVGVPLLIVYAMVNRPYMTDLQNDRSIVRNLLAAGQDVYLIDWGYPDRSDRFTTLDDLLNGTLKRAIEVLAARARVPAVNVLGICQGGAFSLCFAAMHPHLVRNLVTMVTPVDFDTPDNMLANWTRGLDVDALVDAYGNVPGGVMNAAYLALKPLRLNHHKYLSLIDALDKPKEIENFLRMEKWIFDSPDQIGEIFRQFIKDFYQGNKLVKGGLVIGEHAVSLSEVTMPVLNVYAEQDHLVPPDASRALKNLVGTTDYSELAFPGGHIGIYVSGRSQREVPPAIHRWLKARSD